jgi:hypothetical protein
MTIVIFILGGWELPMVNFFFKPNFVFF